MSRSDMYEALIKTSTTLRNVAHRIIQDNYSWDNVNDLDEAVRVLSELSDKLEDKYHKQEAKAK